MIKKEIHNIVIRRWSKYDDWIYYASPFFQTEQDMLSHILDTNNPCVFDALEGMQRGEYPVVDFEFDEIKESDQILKLYLDGNEEVCNCVRAFREAIASNRKDFSWPLDDNHPIGKNECLIERSTMTLFAND